MEEVKSNFFAKRAASNPKPSTQILNPNPKPETQTLNPKPKP